jgi:hypothetical protein
MDQVPRSSAARMAGEAGPGCAAGRITTAGASGRSPSEERGRIDS